MAAFRPSSQQQLHLVALIPLEKYIRPESTYRVDAVPSDQRKNGRRKKKTTTKQKKPANTCSVSATIWSPVASIPGAALASWISFFTVSIPFCICTLEGRFSTMSSTVLLICDVCIGFVWYVCWLFVWCWSSLRWLLCQRSQILGAVCLVGCKIHLLQSNHTLLFGPRQSTKKKNYQKHGFGWLYMPKAP